MAKTTKRITGDYDIITDDGTSGTILLDTQTVTINGNLNVVGTHGLGRVLAVGLGQKQILFFLNTVRQPLLPSTLCLLL